MALEGPLLERARETTVLGDLLDDLRRDHHGRLLVIEGRPGIGKSRLLRHLRSAAEDRGLRTLSARASVLERAFGFGIVRQLLERPAVDEDLQQATREFRRLMSGAPADAPPAPPGSLDARGPAGAAGELTLLHGLYWIVADACKVPTVVLVDDVQWADPESLRFLVFLRLRLPDVPLLLALVCRFPEPDLHPALRGLLEDPEVTALRPAPLGPAASHALLGALLGQEVDTEFGAAAAAATQGNPLLLSLLAGSLTRERLRPVAAAIPRARELSGEAWQRQLGRALTRLPDDVRRIAEAGAVLGSGATIAELAEVTGLEPDVVRAGIGTLADWGLVDGEEARAGSLYEPHCQEAEAVVQLMGEQRRQELLRTGADVLERRGAGVGRIAALVLGLPPGADPAAVDRLVRAADAAQAQGAPESAVTYLQRALAEEMPADRRFDLLVRTGTLALHTDLAVAAPCLEEAVHAQPRGDDPQLWLDWGAALGYLRAPEEAVLAVEHALRVVPEADADLRRRIEALLLVADVLVPGRLDPGTRLARLQALPPADGVGARLLQSALSMHEMARADPRGIARAHEALADGVLVAQANGEGPLVSGWLTLVAAGDPLALRSLDQAVRAAYETGSRRALAAAVTFRALARLRAGRLVDAVEDGVVALDHALGDRVDLDARFGGAFLAEARMEMGLLDSAERVLTTLRAFDADASGPSYAALETAAKLRRLQHRPAEARDLALQAGRVWAAYGFPNPALGEWRSDAALAAYAAGQQAEAVALAEEDLAMARAWGAPGVVGRALRVSGLVGGGAAGLERLAEAVTVLEGSLAGLEAARAAAAYGAALRRAGFRVEARQQLAAALDLAEVCGAAPLVSEVSQEMRAAGFRRRRSRLAGPESLTLSERRVADLACAGSSNRAIAQSLFVTTKTVELHLTSTYRKLGISGREELAAALATS